MEDAIKVHWLPCTVSHTGPAKVGAYFMPKSTGSSSRAVPSIVEDSGNCIQCAFTPGQSRWAIHAGQQTDGYQVEEAHFRGRQLKGMSWQRAAISWVLQWYIPTVQEAAAAVRVACKLVRASTA